MTITSCELNVLNDAKAWARLRWRNYLDEAIRRGDAEGEIRRNGIISCANAIRSKEGISAKRLFLEVAHLLDAEGKPLKFSRPRGRR